MINIENLQALLNSQSRRKVFNFLVNNFERRRKKEVLRSFPYFATMNTTNLCNLRCKFCEIHYFYKKAKEIAGKVFPNNLTANLLKNHDRWLRHIIAMELSGATGEPFVNPHIMEAIDYLKKLGIRLSATTNALLIDEKAAQQLIDSQFDSLLISIHAGDSQAYADLQGGDFNRLLTGLELLIDLRNRLNSHYPRISINFALNRLNADTVKGLMKHARDIGVDSFVMNHYYSSRNILDSDISFYFDTETCDALLRDVYEYAAEIGLCMLPSRPPFLGDMSRANTKEIGRSYCEAPWTTIKFKGCVEYENSEYVSVCNRMPLFRIDYNKFYENSQNSFTKDIWNSGVLQFLRRTINSRQSNSICRFCKDPETPRVRCLDNVEYSRRRDNAIEDFFNEFSRSGIEYREAEGLTLLTENPYKYDEKDGF